MRTACFFAGVEPGSGPVQASVRKERAAAARFLRLALAAFAAVASTAACGEETAGPAELYQRVCSACHGEKGDGKSLAAGALRTSPRDFTTEEARAGLSREYMIAIVRDGRPHTPMVGRTARLSQPEIEGVVDFIRTAFMPPEPGSPRAQGRELYRKACGSCHGDRGQGSAARGAIGPSPPISAARARPGLTAEAMVDAILRREHVPGRPASTPVLSAAEAQAVADYVRATFIEVAAGRRGMAAQKPG